MRSLRPAACRRGGALGLLLLGSTLLPLGMLAACATSKPADTSELPKPPPAYRSDRAEDRVDEECPECLGPGDSTIRQEEEE
jgi:hypothetical protein